MLQFSADLSHSQREAVDDPVTRAPTDEQLKEINRLIRLIDGEPTGEQMWSAICSVMS